jgi:ribonuclease G
MSSVKVEVLINVFPQEVRLAVIENGLLQEVYIERPNNQGIVGNIYKGKVVRVLPGMQAAFVDIGLEKAGFMHVSDLMPIPESKDDKKSVEIDFNSPECDIRKWLKEGQELLVQVRKDPLGTKGARLTSHLSLTSRYLVYLPDLHHIGVSLRLEDETERERLQGVLTDILGENNANGFIIRTVAEGVDKEKLVSDKVFLKKLWKSVHDHAKKLKAPAIAHKDLPLVQRGLRDIVNDNVEKIRVDDNEVYKNLQGFADNFIPGVKDKLVYYKTDTPIFDMYGVEQELEKALNREVYLKSGGRLVFDQTEAMTTIDVNTGAFLGSRNLEETIFKTNLEAVQVLSRQLRLRNLGGIIIIDFIDMLDKDHQRQVMSSLEKALERDFSKTNIGDLSPLGLVQLTRKRTHESLSQQLCMSCPTCYGNGVIKTCETISYEIYREIMREVAIYDQADGFLVLASPNIVNYLLEDASESVGELEASLNLPIKIKAEVSYLPEQYDIILL